MLAHFFFHIIRQRFVDICDGKISKGNMTLMKDISLSKTNAKGEFLYNKIQNISFDEVFSEYMFYPRVRKISEIPNFLIIISFKFHYSISFTYLFSY